MPVKDGIGFGNATYTKNMHFRSLIDLHVKVCQRIFRKRLYGISATYYYFDLTAGTGKHPTERYSTGSVILLEYLRSQIISYNACLIEENPHNYRELAANLQGWPSSHFRQVEIHQGDHAQIFPNCLDVLPDDEDAYGLIYYDPTNLGISNGTSASYEMLAQLTKRPHLQKIDILLYLSVTHAIKRTKSQTNRRLQDWLDLIDKQHWLIRKPYGAEQWTFLLGTNWHGFPEYKKIGFHKRGTPEGDAYFMKMNLTADEYFQATQPSLFDLGSMAV